MITSFKSTTTFQERPIEKNTLGKILLAGRLAPSGHNMQTWRFTVLTSREKISDFRKVSGCVFQNPQAIIIISNDRRNPHGIFDSAAAMENIFLAAHALKLGACRVDFSSSENSLREFFSGLGIPNNHEVYSVIGLGWPVDVVNFAD